MFNIFIQRPLLSTVISLVIVLLGVLALSTLPVTQFPDIVPPSVTVTTNYTGANAEVCAKAVATPLERAINGVPNMTYMTSVSGNDGSTLIQVFFKVGTDPDLAAVNVQNRVTAVLDELPEEVIKAGVITEKEVNSMLLYLNVMSDDPAIDEKFIYNFADINILAELKRIDGVGFAEIMGHREYSMRVWLKPDRMTAYAISPDEVIEVIRQQNVEAAPGKTGESADTEAQMLQYVLRYTGKFFEPQQYENIVLRAHTDGSILRLKDIADIEFGSVDYSITSKTDGRPSAAIMLKQRPGSNASEVIAQVKKRMAELKETTFPPGITYNFAYDVSRFLDASIHEVLRTLVEAFILVFLVVFLFLQDFRSTLIAALAVPVALVGTFACMQMLDFSINLLTLFALVLAIGIVVDNAIVVVEAVHAKMHDEHLSAREATIAAMREISGAIVAITLVMSAVFVPVAFMSGPVGIFYRQFSLTLAIAIVISGINAVTLTPALCALWLRPTHHKGLLGGFFTRFNRGYDAIAGGYGRVLSRFASRGMVTWGVLLLFMAATWGLARVLPGGFIPTEDQGIIYANVTTPVGATVQRTEHVLDDIQKVASRLEAVENVSTLSGFSLLTDGAGASYGMAMINLKHWDDRTASVDDVIAQLEEQTRSITDASIQYFSPPTVPGFGNSSGFEVRMLDRTGSGDLQKTAKMAQDFIKALKKRPEIADAFTSFDPSFPQYLIHVDQEKAAQKGVSIEHAMSTLQTLLGSYYASNFIRFGQMYKVMVQADPSYRTKPGDILRLHVKNNQDEMVPYASFIRLERVYGPEQLTRYNMFTSALITGSAAPGYSSGDANRAIEEVATTVLPRGYSYEWSGMTREEILSGNQTVYIFAICLVFVYLLLVAQYESLLLPLSVLLSLPTGIFGSFLFLQLAGLQNNIYAQVALVMLIGLLGKNAILIVEFAHQRHKEGLPVVQAAVEGAVARLRPILMTSLAFIAGLIPLCMASGAGAMGNRSIGMAAAGGMVTGTVFGLLVVPGLYIFFAWLGGRSGSRPTSLRSKDTDSEETNESDSVSAPVLVNQNRTIRNCLFICLCGAGWLGSGCKSLYPALPQSPELSRPPAVYVSRTDSVTRSDTTSLADQPWQVFFEDPVLKGLLDTAIRRNPDIKVALQRIQQARADVQFRQGALLPSIDAVASAGVEKYGAYTLNGVGNFDTNLSENITGEKQIPNPTPDYFLGFRSSWELDLWGKLRSRRKASFMRLLAVEQGRHWVQTRLLAEVAQTYYQLLMLDSEQDILRRNIELQQQATELIRIQKTAGRVTALAVQQFTAQWLNTRSREAQVKQEIQATENRLNLLLGRYPQPIARGQSLMAQPLPAVLSAGVPSQLLRRRPDIRQAEAELRAARLDVNAARAAFLPSLQLSPYIGLNAFRTSVLFDPSSAAFGVLGGLTAPVFRQRALRADYTRVSAQSQELLYAYHKTILTGVSEVLTHLQGMENYRIVADLKQQEVHALQEAVSTANALFVTGYASYLEVITAQRSVLEAELNLVATRNRQFTTLIGLYRSLGGGWESQ